MLLLAASPLAPMVFESLFQLRPELRTLAQQALLLAAVTSALGAIISFSQGGIVTARRTALITKSVFVHLVVVAVLLWWAIQSLEIAGILAVVPAFAAGMFVQFLYLTRHADRILSDTRA